MSSYQDQAFNRTNSYFAALNQQVIYPNTKTPCTACPHIMGYHYRTYNTYVTGCAFPTDDTTRCTCAGFQMIYRGS